MRCMHALQGAEADPGSRGVPEAQEAPASRAEAQGRRSAGSKQTARRSSQRMTRAQVINAT